MAKLDSAVRVEFIGLVPTLYAHCSHCMEVMQMCELDPYYEQLKEYPKDVVEMYYQVTKMILDLKREFGDRIFVDVVDAASIQGVWKTLRYRILKTPCIAVNGRKAFDGIPSYEVLRSKLSESIQSTGMSLAVK